MYVKNIEDLKIYKLSLELTKKIHEITANIPNNWRYDDIKQIIRSSSSVTANIEEGFANRFYVKKFINYLYIAMGSSDETKTHLKNLINKNIVDIKIGSHLVGQYKSLSVKILNFILYLRKKHNINHYRPTTESAPPSPHNS